MLKVVLAVGERSGGRRDAHVETPRRLPVTAPDWAHCRLCALLSISTTTLLETSAVNCKKFNDGQRWIQAEARWWTEVRISAHDCGRVSHLRLLRFASRSFRCAVPTVSISEHSF